MTPEEPSANDAQKRKMDVTDGIEKVVTRDTLVKIIQYSIRQ
jgi:hypothetical protein